MASTTRVTVVDGGIERMVLEKTHWAVVPVSNPQVYLHKDPFVYDTINGVDVTKPPFTLQLTMLAPTANVFVDDTELVSRTTYFSRIQAPSKISVKSIIFKAGPNPGIEAADGRTLMYGDFPNAVFIHPGEQTQFEIVIEHRIPLSDLGIQTRTYNNYGDTMRYLFWTHRMDVYPSTVWFSDGSAAASAYDLRNMTLEQIVSKIVTDNEWANSFLTAINKVQGPTGSLKTNLTRSPSLVDRTALVTDTVSLPAGNAASPIYPLKVICNDRWIFISELPLSKGRPDAFRTVFQQVLS